MNNKFKNFEKNEQFQTFPTCRKSIRIQEAVICQKPKTIPSFGIFISEFVLEVCLIFNFDVLTAQTRSSGYSGICGTLECYFTEILISKH